MKKAPMIVVVLVLALGIFAIPAAADDDFGIDAPAEGEVVGLGDDVRLEATGPTTGGVQWAVRHETDAPGTNTVAGNVDGFSTDYSWEDGSFSATLDTTGFDPGTYFFVFNPGDAGRYTSSFEVEEALPFVRITYLCQVPEDPEGTHARLFTGTDTELHEAEAGEYVWRIGDPRDADLWTGGLQEARFWTNFLEMEGTVSAGEAQFHMTDDGANGVSVSTDPGPNQYGGTATVSGAECSMETPPPEAKDDCRNGGYADFGFRNQGLCIASLTANENSRH